MEKTEILITSAQIQEKIKNLASRIKEDYKDKSLVLIGILDGAFMLMADLSRELFKLEMKDFEVDFIGVSSYLEGTKSSKKPKITKELVVDILRKDVLIVEDIIDTGWSIDFLIKYLKEKNPKQVKLLSLLSKPARRELKVKIDYLGFEIENVWVEGYGMDTDQKGRGNPDIIRKRII